MPIAYKLSCTNRKRKYFEEKITATLKSKQTLIATVRYHLLPVAIILTPLIFNYPLPLKRPSRKNLNVKYKKPIVQKKDCTCDCHSVVVHLCLVKLVILIQCLQNY
jgi:hypothetical protein